LQVACGQEISKIQRPVSKIGLFSLRNDGKDLMKPIGSPVPLVRRAKEEVKKIEKEEVSVEAVRPKVPKPTPVKPEEVKKEEVVKKEERLGLKFAEGKEELPKVVAITKIPPKPEVAPIMPEESKYFLQLAPEEEPLPKIKPKVRKPKPTPPTPPKEEVVVAKVEEVEEIIPPVPPVEEAEEEEVVTKKPVFAFQRINPVLRWGIIISGLFTLILILLVRYLWRQRELGSLAEIGEVPVERHAHYKALVEDIKELQAGYRGLEKMIENVEKRLAPLSSLKGATIEEVTRDTSKEIFKPLESGIKELQATCQGLEKMFGEFDKRLAPLDALKGLSIKELAHQTSMEFYRPLENELKKMQVSYERMMSEFEERIDKKVESLNKKSKSLEKTVSEIDSRLITVDSIISSLPRPEGAVTKPMIKAEEVKPGTAKDKRTREILHNQIYKLSDEGLSIDEIAQRTKLGKGEVRLILGLRKK
jgi:archaellum component FlaC